jgi:energy-coupling factor transport system substrate-specific component
VSRRFSKLSVREICIFAVLGALMFVLKTAMTPLPSIHPVGVLTAAYTIAYRRKALYPLYIYILLDGLLHGFSPWWMPYLYIWAVLWGFVMLIPRKARENRRIAVPVCIAVCGLHGLMFGLLYLPFWALYMSFTSQQALAWWIMGLGFDLTHCLSNAAMGFLVVPIAELLRRLEAGSGGSLKNFS